MTQTATDKLREATGIVKRQPTVDDMLVALKPQLARVLNRNVNPDRLVRIVLTEIRKNPDLGLCEPQSLLGCVMTSAQLHLEPGIFGQCYFVPYKRKGSRIATFITGWQGYVDLVSRSGRSNAWTGAVREGDEFDCSLGSKPFLKHKPDWDGDPERKLLYTYSVGRLTGAETPVIDVWGVGKIRKHLQRYNKIGDAHYALQNENNFEMYGRKLPLLQVVKYLPKSVELQAAAGLDYAADAGTQALTIDAASNVLDGDSSEPQAQAEPEVEVEIPQKIREMATHATWSDREVKSCYAANNKSWESVEAALEKYLQEE